MSMRLLLFRLSKVERRWIGCVFERRWIGCVFPAPNRDVKPGLAFSRDRVIAQAHRGCLCSSDEPQSQVHFWLQMRDWEISDDHFNIHRRRIGAKQPPSTMSRPWEHYQIKKGKPA
jgi:hypothetical protein